MMKQVIAFLIIPYIFCSIGCDKNAHYSQKENISNLENALKTKLSISEISDTAYFSEFIDEDGSSVTTFSKLKISPEYFIHLTKELNLARYGDSTSTYYYKGVSFSDINYYTAFWKPASIKGEAGEYPNNLYWWNLNYEDKDSLYAQHYSVAIEKSSKAPHGLLKMCYQNGWAYILVEA